MLRDAKEYKGMVSDADERKGKLQNERKNTMENAEECWGMPRIVKEYYGMISNTEKRKEMQKKKKESDKLSESQAIYTKT